ncbi:unnamed protein product [Oikopleura dioica]|uniref:HAT C-terminal dimerisation domain-containing protein n=1 Tax=Oikopleura dioica TaxID=34765 RepID=E4XVI6_OIKDI|nr:unnamed protein product [Oikopleura dioica]
MYEVPENFSAKYDKDENYLGSVKCSNDRCKPFICRDSYNKKKLKIENWRFWDDHNLLMPTLSKIALKIARLSSSSNEAEREFSCLSYQMGPSFMNQKAAHIERKQQTAECDRFKKALTKIVMQKGIESSALGCSKSAAGMII